MKPVTHRSFRLLQFLIGFKLTPVGRLAVGAILLSAIGSVTVEIVTYQIFCVMLTLFGVVELTGMLMRPKLKVTGWLPERVTAGEVAVGYVTIENLGRLPALDLMCSFPGLPSSLRHVTAAEVIPSLASGEQATLPMSIQVFRRGEYAVPAARIHSTFPLNLMRFGGARLPKRKLTVLPSFHQLEEFDVPISLRYQPGGVVVEGRRGDSPEYVGNREYVPGEPVKRVDFRAWARIGRPVVREYQDEFCSRVALVLDTHRSRRVLGGSASANDMEAAVSLTAAIADALNQQETNIDIFAAGPDLFLFQTSSGTTHFESVLEILSAVEQTRWNPFEKLSPAIAESLESISVVVCVLLDWDDTREELTRRIIESGCALRVLLIRSREPTNPIPDDENFATVSADAFLAGAIHRI